MKSMVTVILACALSSNTDSLRSVGNPDYQLKNHSTYAEADVKKKKKKGKKLAEKGKKKKKGFFSKVFGSK